MRVVSEKPTWLSCQSGRLEAVQESEIMLRALTHWTLSTAGVEVFEWTELKSDRAVNRWKPVTE